ncbi:MAG: AAA family ATPase [Thermomonas sp.]|nr:AAA family ATPase [Thermomonas sp.]MCO5055460.1 AAA family ATPase [Thermomonas sp.]
MKTILITNRKGGVGKSAIASQYAHYLADKLGQRVLFIDLDSQANSTKALTAKQAATASTTKAAEAFTNKTATVEYGNFVVMPGTPELDFAGHGTGAAQRVCRQLAFIARVGEQFDVCVIDTAPTLDIRMKAAVISTDYLVAPIQLAQEAIDGLRSLLKTVSAAKDSLNPGLHFIGILPNQVMDTPFQKENLSAIVQHLANLLIALPEGGFGPDSPHHSHRRIPGRRRTALEARQDQRPRCVAQDRTQLRPYRLDDGRSPHLGIRSHPTWPRLTSARSTSCRPRLRATLIPQENKTARREFPLDVIDEDPDQPRKEFEPAKLEELAASIKESGVLQPITIKLHLELPGRYVIRYASLPRIKDRGQDDHPGIFISHEGDEYAQVIENEQRDNLTALELAAFIQKTAFCR